MDLLFLDIALLCLTLLFVYFTFYNRRLSSNIKLPPGNKGWPIIGETLDFAMAGLRGTPEKFTSDRMAKHSTVVFKTSLLGEDMAVLCGPEGNKFLFTNENKCVTSWWPKSVGKILVSEENQTKMEQEIKDLRHNFLPEFLKPEALQEYIPIMDSMAKQHLDADWSPWKQVKVYPLIKKYSFALACDLFMSVKDPEHVNRISGPFLHIAAGILSLPINLPGTAYNRGIKGGKCIREMVTAIIKQRRKELQLSNKESKSKIDILTRMLLTSEVRENTICDSIIGLLVAGHDTVSTAITSAINYIAQYPDVYQEVFKEQTEIAKSKHPGELLNWNDIKKMKYSWCVGCEAMRLMPPTGGTFREVINDFTYAGLSIPKGWKTHWSVHSTHKNPKYFPHPEKFDPSRFEGIGPAPYTFVPFGGGPRMCPGKEYARLEMLVFMHNVVTKFKLRKINPDEKIIYSPAPTLQNGLLVKLEHIGNCTTT